MLRHIIMFGSLVALAGSTSLAQTDNYQKDLSAISVNPSRIILGDLPYGSKEKIVIRRDLIIEGVSPSASQINIDVSHAKGITILSQHNAFNEIHLTIGIDLALFSEGQRFGTFIKELIRIQTDSAQQPQLIVPVIGWLSDNQTARDFTKFAFDGRTRWQGWWANPNDAGAVMVPLVAFCIGALAWISTKRKHVMRYWNYILTGLLLGDTLMVTILLAYTYSRAAWFALTISMLILTINPGILRKYAIMELVGFSIFLCLLPSGLHRIQTYSHVESDVSILNRLKLYSGAFQIMADYPWGGIGPGQFETVFERDYQQYDHTASHSIVPSDYMKVGAEYGILALGISVGVLIYTALYSFRIVVENKDIFQTTLLAALIAILITSSFSALWSVREYEWIFGLCILGSLSFIIRKSLQSRGVKETAAHLTKGFSKSICASLIILTILAFSSTLLLPTRTYLYKKNSDKTGSDSYIVVKPRWIPSKGLIIYCSGAEDGPQIICHSTLRPLSALGWQVVWSRDTMDEHSVEAFVESAHTVFTDKKVFLVGKGSGGRLAWMVATNLTSTNKAGTGVCAGAGVEFFTNDLEFESGSKPMKMPFLVIQSLFDDKVTANPAIRAYRQDRFSTLPITICLSDQEVNLFSPAWLSYLKEVDLFFSKY